MDILNLGAGNRIIGDAGRIGGGLHQVDPVGELGLAGQAGAADMLVAPFVQRSHRHDDRDFHFRTCMVARSEVCAPFNWAGWSIFH